MVSFTTSLYERLTLELQEITLQADNTLQKAERCHKAAQSFIKELKAFIIGYEFKDKEEEISFFKDIKPKFLKERIYYDELFCFEAGKPVGHKEIQLNYFHQAIERIRLFFERNQQLYNYYRLGKSNDDELFYLRSNEQRDADDEFDTRFCTSHSYKLAKIKAFEHLKEYLLTGIQEPEKETSPVSELVGIPKLYWTDSKVDFTEWVYGVHAAGSINNGNINAKQLFIAFQHFLNINAGNHYSALQQNIRIRKKGSRTTYHDRVKTSLEKRMDDSDENPRYG